MINWFYFKILDETNHAVKHLSIICFKSTILFNKSDVMNFIIDSKGRIKTEWLHLSTINDRVTNFLFSHLTLSAHDLFPSLSPWLDGRTRKAPLIFTLLNIVSASSLDTSLNHGCIASASLKNREDHRGWTVGS